MKIHVKLGPGKESRLGANRVSLALINGNIRKFSVIL